MIAIRRHAVGCAAVLASYGLGCVIESLVGVPAPLAGLVLYAIATLLSPSALRRTGPTADGIVRWLPLLFVPLAVGGLAVVGDNSPLAIALAIVVSVPIGFLVAALVAR